MLSAAAVNPRDTIIEIGPGKGALTGPLLETGARVIAYELDLRMVEFLEDKFKDFIETEKLILIHGDILEADIAVVTGNQAYKLVANIPYYITNLIIRSFLSSSHKPELLCLLVQKEVAERIVARDGKESILSLSVKLYGQPSYEMKVSRKYFSPIPRVDSAIISISRGENAHDISPSFEENYFKVIKAAFGQKRKQAIKNLQVLADKSLWEKLFLELDLSLTARAEDIPFETWLKIIDKFTK